MKGRDKVYAGGYPDTMIIQDFIPGDDSYMRVLGHIVVAPALAAVDLKGFVAPVPLVVLQIEVS